MPQIPLLPIAGLGLLILMFKGYSQTLDYGKKYRPMAFSLSLIISISYVLCLYLFICQMSFIYRSILQLILFAICISAYYLRKKLSKNNINYQSDKITGT